MMTRNEKRFQERMLVNFPALLKGQVSRNQGWEDSATICNISKNSMGFYLNKEFKVGRLLCVTAQVPTDLRGGSKERNDYMIWGIVQHCTKVSDNNPSGKIYLGLALIGEEPPASYATNPLQNYRLTGAKDDGFWQIKEVEREFVARKHYRFNAIIDVFLGQLDKNNRIYRSESVTTDNISVGGSAVFTSLDVKIGEALKFVAVDHEFSAMAIVRNVTSKNNKRSKVNLEFVSNTFPLSKLKTLEKI